MLTLGRIARDMRGLSRAGVVLTLATLLVVLVAVVLVSLTERAGSCAGRRSPVSELFEDD